MIGALRERKAEKNSIRNQMKSCLRNKEKAASEISEAVQKQIRGDQTMP